MLVADAEDAARLRLLRSLGWDVIDTDLPVFMLGLVSVQASAIHAVVEQMTGSAPPDDLLISHPSINSIARFVANGSHVSGQQAPGLDWQ